MYLTNKDLYVEVIVSKAQGKLTRNAEKMLELLAKKTIKKMRYWSNDDKLDCYQSGLLDMFQNWYNFNEDKTTNVQRYKISSISYDFIKLHLEFFPRNYHPFRQ